MTEPEPIDHLAQARLLLADVERIAEVGGPDELPIMDHGARAAIAHALIAIAERLPGGTTIVCNDAPPTQLNAAKVAEKVKETLDNARKRGRRRDL